MIGHFIFRLVLWFLLTANFGVANILIGIIIALLLPRRTTSPERLQDLLRGLVKILVAIPQAYVEAIEMILHPHTREEIVMERVSSQRSPGLVFLDIFLITFTPKTIVLKYHEESTSQFGSGQQSRPLLPNSIQRADNREMDSHKEGWYEVHYVRRRKAS